MAEYIDKEELMKEFCRTCDNGRMLVDEPCLSADICTGLTLLRNFPIEDVVPVRRGRWIWREQDIYRCSECNREANVAEFMDEPIYNFCPNCGAKMDGKVSEEGKNG